MAEESQSQTLQVPPDQLDFAKKNGADNEDDDHDLFKSAMEVSFNIGQNRLRLILYMLYVVIEYWKRLLYLQS